jgi:hypothetical protein
MANRGDSDTPLWYTALASLFGALGIGLVALLLGIVVLIASREKPGGGLRSALVTTVVVGLISSWAVFYGATRITQ